MEKLVEGNIVVYPKTIETVKIEWPINATSLDNIGSNTLIMDKDEYISTFQDAARYARLDAARQRQQEENDLAASKYVATTGNDNEDDGA